MPYNLNNRKVKQKLEEELTKQFGEVLKNIHIDNEKLDLFKDTLRDSYTEELKYTKKKITILNTQKTKLENRLEQLYLDKLDGKIH